MRPGCCADNSCADSESWSVPASFFFLPRSGPSVDTPSGRTPEPIAERRDPRRSQKILGGAPRRSQKNLARYYKKPRNTCDTYIEKNSVYYCKRAKYIDPYNVQASVACPITCDVCNIPDL